MSFLSNYSRLDPKEKVKYTLRLLRGVKSKSTELEQLIRAQAEEDRIKQFPEVITKLKGPEMPDNEAFWYIFKEQLNWSNRRIEQMLKKIPQNRKLYPKIHRQ